MLAVADRREVHARDATVRLLSGRVPRPVFRAAYKELCTRIWIELELLAQAAGQSKSYPALNLAMSTAILRLELIVLLDSSRSAHWHCMLSPEQCDRVCSMLADVLAALYVDSEYLDGGIAAAQDRVLDELMPECESEPSLTDPLSTCEAGCGWDPAVEVLIGLIEERAAARA
jgi:hypothetical protein